MCVFYASLVAQSVKNLPTMQEKWVQFLGQEDTLEKEMATHSSGRVRCVPGSQEETKTTELKTQRTSEVIRKKLGGDHGHCEDTRLWFRGWEQPSQWPQDTCIMPSSWEPPHPPGHI